MREWYHESVSKTQFERRPIWTYCKLECPARAAALPGRAPQGGRWRLLLPRASEVVRGLDMGEVDEVGRTRRITRRASGTEQKRTLEAFKQSGRKISYTSTIHYFGHGVRNALIFEHGITQDRMSMRLKSNQPGKLISEGRQRERSSAQR